MDDKMRKKGREEEEKEERGEFWGRKDVKRGIAMESLMEKWLKKMEKIRRNRNLTLQIHKYPQKYSESNVLKDFLKTKS